MAKRVKWQGNAADLPQQEHRVRYVGTGQGGSKFQPYEENDTENTATAENTIWSGSGKKKKSATDRIGLTASGGAKGSLAGNMDAEGVAYEAGQGGRTKRDTAELKEAQWAVARAKHDYDLDSTGANKSALDIATSKVKAIADVLGDGAYEQALSAAYDVAAQIGTGDARSLYNSLGVVMPKEGTGVQQLAASAARDLAAKVQESGAEDIQKAKDGTSKFWQMLIDAGASSVQMGLDAASNAILGTQTSMIPFATRAFGGATMEARQGNADLGKQALYGTAQTAKEVFTEKMFNIALPFAKAYGKGGFDGIVENGIRKAADKLGKSKVGKAALEKAMTIGASAITEGLEELVGDWMEWQLPRIYGGDAATAEETLSESLYDFVVGSMAGVIGGAMGEPMKAIDSAVQAQETKKIYGAQQQDLVNESEELNPGNELAQKYREQMSNGKDLSGRQLLRIIQQNETDMLEGDKKTVRTAAEKRLNELGETDNVQQLAELVARQTAGEMLSRREQTQIENSEHGKQVLDELNPKNEIEGKTEAEWTKDLGTVRVNRNAYKLAVEIANQKIENGLASGQKIKAGGADGKQIRVTGAKYNPETKKLDAIVKDAGGEIKTVPADQAKLTPVQEELFDWADGLQEAGSVMVGAYQPTQNLELYAKSFRLAYEYGKTHVPMDYVESSEAVNYLHPAQLKMAYEEGQKAAQSRTQAREEKLVSGGTQAAVAKKKPAVSLRGATVGGKTYAAVDKKAMTRKQWASVEAMRAFSRATGVDVVFYQSQTNEKGEYEGSNGLYKDGTVYLDVNAGKNSTQDVQTAVLKTASHELTHFIQQNSPAQYEELKRFVVERLVQQEDMGFEDLVTDKQRREDGLSYDDAADEVVADACEMMLQDSKAVEQLAKENRSLAQRIADWLRKWVRSIKVAVEGMKAERPESRAMLQYAEELQKLWDDALVTAVRNNRGEGESHERNSIRNIVGFSGKDYGVGVYLDSALLESLTETERIQMVKERIRELGGKHFVAYNMNGEKVDIQIAESSARFVNKSGKSVPVNNDLATKNRKSAIKQETVVLADEMISVARHKKSNPAKYPHGWLDNNGRNDWEEWKTFVQDRGGSVWEATLHIATAKTGQKYLYDIDPIKMAEQSGKSDTSTANHSIRHSSENSQEENFSKVQNQKRESRLSDRDVLRMAAEMAQQQKNKSWTEEDRNRLDIFAMSLNRLKEAEAELAALKEERKELMAGRKVSEVTGEERLEMLKNNNRIDIERNKIKRLESEVYEIESKTVIKTLLKKSRSIVEQDAAFKARQRYREKAEARQNYMILRKRLERTTSEWKRMLLRPTKDRYAPEELVRSCLDVAAMLDESGPKEGTKSKDRYETASEALAYMKRQYDALEDSDDQFYRLGYDEELSELVEQLRDALSGKAIRDLTYEEAGDVALVLVSMQGILKDARYQIGSGERKSTQELVDGAVKQMKNVPKRTKTEAATDAVARYSASVMRNIRRMCQYDDNAALYKLFRQMEEGVKKKDRFIMESNKIFDRFAGDRMRKSSTEIKTYSLGGAEVGMTEMELMQLILAARRELTDKTNHLNGKGFIIPDLKLMRKGQVEDAIAKGTEVGKTALGTILELENELDAWAKDYMNTASEYFNGMARNAINDAEVQTKHRRVAMTKNYVPYEVDRRTVQKDVEGVKYNKASIESDGMLKSVKDDAQNALIIRGLDAVVENHIERVGRIYGLAVPIRNFNKAYNARSEKGLGMSMKEAISRAYPAADAKLIEQAVTDLQTSRERATDDLSRLLRKTEGKFVEATLLSNISVTIKQAASYSTAGLYLSQKALFPYQTTIAKLFAKNNSSFAKKLFEEIDEHTSMHYMRRKGMSMEEAAMIAQDSSKVVRWMDKKLPDAANPLKWIQNMDVATTAALWLATKKQVELDGVKQSDPAYWSRVTQLYEKVISETQPMYDSLHRPEVQKSTNEVLRGLMMFRTQPLQNAGILYDAAGEAAQAKKSGNQEQIKATNRKLRMAITSQIASLAVFSTMTLLAYAVRNRMGRYRDDEEELTVTSVMMRVLGDMAVNGAQLIAPIGGGVVAGGLEKWITDSSYGGELSIPTIEAINNWVSQMNKVRQDIVKLSEDEEADIVTDSVDFAMESAGMLGIPAKNAFGILRGIVGNITDMTGHKLDWATDEPEPSTAIVKACFENGHMEKGRETIKQVIALKMDAGKEEKEARAAVRSSLTAYYKKLYLRAYKKKNEKEMKRIRMVIQGSRMYDDNAADVAAGWVKKWAEDEKKKKNKK